VNNLTKAKKGWVPKTYKKRPNGPQNWQGHFVLGQKKKKKSVRTLAIMIFASPSKMTYLRLRFRANELTRRAMNALAMARGNQEYDNHSKQAGGAWSQRVGPLHRN
jgi:hypothetical protein